MLRLLIQHSINGGVSACVCVWGGAFSVVGEAVLHPLLHTLPLIRFSDLDNSHYINENSPLKYSKAPE